MSADDRAEGLALIRAMLPVSRETEARLDRYSELLRRWQGAKNLVGPETLSHLWIRHIADSAQALGCLPDARRWLDLGSGAGLPGLITAILLADTPDAAVHLVESNGRKCAFLRAAARETEAPAIVHCSRIEQVGTQWTASVDAVSARALAPLRELLALAAPFLQGGAVGVFHKGQDIDAELIVAEGFWAIKAEILPSRTDARGSIVIVRDCSLKTA